MLQQLEKQREIGVLRALGLTNNQMMGLILLETSLMGLISGILAVPAGYILSLVLIFVINQRSFGWTLQYYPDIGTALQAFIIALVAALLAAIYPAIRVRKMSIANVIRNE
jgi:putative ABC transport system permease protein